MEYNEAVRRIRNGEILVSENGDLASADTLNRPKFHKSLGKGKGAERVGVDFLPEHCKTEWTKF